MSKRVFAAIGITFLQLSLLLLTAFDGANVSTVRAEEVKSQPTQAQVQTQAA